MEVLSIEQTRKYIRKHNCHWKKFQKVVYMKAGGYLKSEVDEFIRNTAYLKAHNKLPNI